MLVDGASGQSNAHLGSAGRTFDQGRVLLAVISIASVIAATLASWLWVGNGLLSRLSRLSDRMRLMARGDLATPMPETGSDEIGELAVVLEVFCRQALEVQRLNLVEQLYAELREANDELTRMQARLVKNEQLAALGELVSGVAHEMSNPLNLVKNFSEGSLELFGELTEILDGYGDVLSEDDANAIQEVKDELADSLNRVQENGGRVLAIVDRMRGLGVVGGDPEPTDLNTELPMAVHAECITFETEQGGLHVGPTECPRLARTPTPTPPATATPTPIASPVSVVVPSPTATQAPRRNSGSSSEADREPVTATPTFTAKPAPTDTPSPTTTPTATLTPSPTFTPTSTPTPTRDSYVDR